MAPAAAERGEPWLTLLAPGGMSALLERHGFGAVEHVRQRDSIPAALWDRTDSLRPAGLVPVLAGAIGDPVPLIPRGLSRIWCTFAGHFARFAAADP